MGSCLSSPDIHNLDLDSIQSGDSGNTSTGGFCEHPKHKSDDDTLKLVSSVKMVKTTGGRKFAKRESK